MPSMNGAMSIAAKVRAIATLYERNESEQGEHYAKRELRLMLNDLSNALLNEMQSKREKAYG